MNMAQSLYLTSHGNPLILGKVSKENERSKESVASQDSKISTSGIFQKFPDERAAIDYIESRRWTGGIDCPYCGSIRNSRQRDYQYHQCKDCRRKFTVRTGTVLERSHIPLRAWLYSMYRLESGRERITSAQLSRDLGITQKSAWSLLKRLNESLGHLNEPLH